MAWKVGSIQTAKHQPLAKVGSLQKSDRKDDYIFSPGRGGGGGGGGWTLHMKGVGMLVGNFELNS